MPPPTKKSIIACMKENMRKHQPSKQTPLHYGTPSLNFFAEVCATSAFIDKLPETTFLNSKGYTKKTIFDRTASVQSTQTWYFPIQAVISLLCRIPLKFHSKTCWSKFMNEEAGKP
jgi:hypothetical protein